jgi:hypothetical protein
MKAGFAGMGASMEANEELEGVRGKFGRTEVGIGLSISGFWMFERTGAGNRDGNPVIIL